MQIRIFTIPVQFGAEVEAELNRFLAAHRIVSIDRALVQDGANSAWTLCIGYETGEARPQPPGGKRARRDPREVLTPEEFAVYDKLRRLRKEIAERDGVAAYLLFTNDQLMEICQRDVRSAAALGRIPGVGAARVEKYGEPFLNILREAPPRAPTLTGSPNKDTPATEREA
jgi:superfamily II DNA helicase RecQ